MDKEERKETDLKKDMNITDEEGLKIAYNMDELDRHFPQLMREVSNKKKSLKIKGVDYEIEHSKNKNSEVQDSPYSEDLYNPGAIDFIRRCKNSYREYKK